jgi:uncharacterized protein with von Willebrand factor type A (vWA) domain
MSNSFMSNPQFILLLLDDLLDDLLYCLSQELLKAGIPLTLEQYESLLLDLFRKLRKAGMALTLDQYDLLRQAVAQGYGLGGWEDLKRVCRLLWVKPCDNYDGSIFDRTFDEYIKQDRFNKPVESKKTEAQPTEETSSEEKTPPPEPPSNLPQIPPRKWKSPSTQEQGKEKVPVAVKTEPPTTMFTDVEKDYHLIPRDFPIGLQDIQRAWRLLKRTVRISSQYELDIEATIDQIEQEGIFNDVVMRPVKTRRIQMLLLIDDSLAMIPFFPAFEPLIQAIKTNRITPAQIYRFTSYPDEYVYHWNRPATAESLRNLLPKLHRNRTIAVILSDAGAATHTFSEERIKGILNFLVELSPNIRLLVWLNPLPPVRWEQTSAWIINDKMNFYAYGKMFSYEPASLQRVIREIPQ